MLERTCCICRAKASKRSLARLVAYEGVLVWDVAQKASGRGAYVHLNAQCISKVSNVSSWERAFRLKKGTLKQSVVNEVARSLLQEVHSCISGGS